MGSLILIFTVIATTTLPINNVCSKSLTENDVEHVLQTLQDLIQQEQFKKHKHVQDKRDDEDSEDDTDNYGALKNYQVNDVLHLTKGNRHRLADKEEHRSNHRDLNNDQLSQQILEQLLHSKQERGQQQHKQKQYRVKTTLNEQHHLLNDLLASLGLSDDRQNHLDLANNDDDKKVDLDLGDYSKVYVVLNSEAVRKSKNKKKLNSFLSNLLSASSDNQRARKKERRYKGFVVKDFEARRFNHDSNEMSDNNYKPKRSRGERGGGGRGGGGGRTAIPYIGHRGDIYENED